MEGDQPAVVDEQATAMFHQMVPFAAELGVEVLSNSREEVRARLAWSPGRTTTGGAMHGGVIMALADTAGAVCAFLNLPEGASGTATIESKTNFLRAVRGGHVTAVSRPLHAGRRFVVVETDILDDDGKLAARVTQSQAVL
jgi:1,4-dihydroxy-2-naphthoyl-CoA hydrolase